MERTILKHLKGWQHSHYRKPLYLRGVSRSGKTWVLKEFGKQCYRNTVYISLREHGEYRQFFENTEAFDAGRLLQNLMLGTGQRITPEKTLLILDDIQDCPQVLDILEAFYEQAPRFHIACAGIPVKKELPAGKLNIMELGPMTFSEVLKADGNEELSEYLEDMETLIPIPELWSRILTEKLKMYFVTGGMPEAVYTWIKRRDVEALQEKLSGICGIYEHSFAVYTGERIFPKVLSVWKSLPAQLARENKKFFYKLVKEGARAREYEDALTWLTDAGYAKKICRSHVPGIPISAFDDLSAFRVYLPDTGLLRRMLQIPASAFTEGSRLFTEANEALAENYILNSLTEQFNITPRYWSQNNPFHEIDFIIQWENEIIPAEVRPASHKESRSMKRYCEKFGENLKFYIRYSMDNLNYSNNQLNIPLYLADYTKKIISSVYESEI